MIKKRKIAIFGSTGSIGKNTLEVIKKDIKNFDVIFLSANTNYKLCNLFINSYIQKIRNRVHPLI